jgi:hypothetical protein
VTQAWALVVPRESAAALARLRQFPRLTVHETAAGEIWLRGSELDSELDRQLRLVPGGRRLSVLDDGQTVPEGRQVPLGHLPTGNWTPLAAWLVIALPAAQPSRVPVEPMRLSLVPSGIEREPSLLETSLASWRQYVATAPQWRIDRWAFVASREGQVLVRGTPLPPIAGTQWVLEEGIGVPAGLAWSPPLDARTLRQALKLASAQFALLRPDGSWERIDETEWTRASRSAVHATSEALPQ